MPHNPVMDSLHSLLKKMPNRKPIWMLRIQTNKQTNKKQKKVLMRMAAITRSHLRLEPKQPSWHNFLQSVMISLTKLQDCSSSCRHCDDGGMIKFVENRHYSPASDTAGVQMPTAAPSCPVLLRMSSGPTVQHTRGSVPFSPCADASPLTSADCSSH